MYVKIKSLSLLSTLFEILTTIQARIVCSRGSPYPHLPVPVRTLRLQHYCAQLDSGSGESKLRFSIFCDKHYPLSHLPSPVFIFRTVFKEGMVTQPVIEALWRLRQENHCIFFWPAGLTDGSVDKNTCNTSMRT